MNFLSESHLITEKDELEYGIKVFALSLAPFFIIGMTLVPRVDFISRHARWKMLCFLLIDFLE